MKSNCSAGKDPQGPQCCGFTPPTLGVRPSPPACCLPDPANTTNGTPPLIHPAHIIPGNASTHQPPALCSTFREGALVKSNPIIRLSAVLEKKELSSRFCSRLPFLFPTHLLFHSKWRHDDTLGPFGQLLLSFSRLDLTVRSIFRCLNQSGWVFLSGSNVCHGSEGSCAHMVPHFCEQPQGTHTHPCISVFVCFTQLLTLT